MAKKKREPTENPTTITILSVINAEKKIFRKGEEMEERKKKYKKRRRGRQQQQQKMHTHTHRGQMEVRRSVREREIGGSVWKPNFGPDARSAKKWGRVAAGWRRRRLRDKIRTHEEKGGEYWSILTNATHSDSSNRPWPVFTHRACLRACLYIRCIFFSFRFPRYHHQ